MRLLTHPGFAAAGLCSLQTGKNKGHIRRVSSIRVCTGRRLGGAAAATNTHRHDVTPAQDQRHCLHLHWRGQPAEQQHDSDMHSSEHHAAPGVLSGCCFTAAALLRGLLLLLYCAHLRPAKLLHCFDELRHYAQLLKRCSHAASLLDHSCQISFVETATEAPRTAQMSLLGWLQSNWGWQCDLWRTLFVTRWPTLTVWGTSRAKPSVSHVPNNAKQKVLIYLIYWARQLREQRSRGGAMSAEEEEGGARGAADNVSINL